MKFWLYCINKRAFFVNYINRTCADVIIVAPPPVSDVCSTLSSCELSQLRHWVNMAGTVANKCLSPLAFLTRRLSAPEFITQCCYHKKVKGPVCSFTLTGSSANSVAAACWFMFTPTRKHPGVYQLTDLLNTGNHDSVRVVILLTTIGRWLIFSWLHKSFKLHQPAFTLVISNPYLHDASPLKWTNVLFHCSYLAYLRLE